MITVKGSAWRPDDFGFLADVIAIGISEACESPDRECKSCKYRLACTELKSAREYAKKKA